MINRVARLFLRTCRLPMSSSLRHSPSRIKLVFLAFMHLSPDFCTLVKGIHKHARDDFLDMAYGDCQSKVQGEAIQRRHHRVVAAFEDHLLCLIHFMQSIIPFGAICFELLRRSRGLDRHELAMNKKKSSLPTTLRIAN